MTDIEQLVRDALGDHARALPLPPRAAEDARRAAGRRRRNTAVLAAAAAVTGVVAAASLLPRLDGPDHAVPAQSPLEQSVVRDGIRLAVRLDDSTPEVGQTVTGELTVTNTRDDGVQVLAGCGRQPSLTFDYSGLIAPEPASPAGVAGEFEQRLLGPLPSRGTGVDPLFTFAPRTYSPPVPERALRCPPDEPPTELPAGASLARRVSWTVQTPGSAATDADVPAQAVIAYLLPDGPGGAPVAGDPESAGSTTPHARDLLLRFAVQVRGGDRTRASLPQAVRGAVTDSRFTAALQDAPRRSWRFAWVLPTDKPAPALTFGQADTDPAFGSVGEWHIVLVYGTSNGERRLTATVDARTGQVTEVSQGAER